EREQARADTKPLRRAVEGDWHGNDTLWRTVLDLNRVLLHADENGVLRDDRQRRYLSVVDGIVGGEEEGPLVPTPRRAGVLVAGEDGAAVALVCTRIMGLDPSRIPMVRNAFADVRHPVSRVRPGEVRVVGPSGAPACEPRIPFRASAGWVGHCEDAPAASAD